jgi:hypothetical protein
MRGTTRGKPFSRVLCAFMYRATRVLLRREATVLLSMNKTASSLSRNRPGYFSFGMQSVLFVRSTWIHSTHACPARVRGFSLRSLAHGFSRRRILQQDVNGETARNACHSLRSGYAKIADHTRHAHAHGMHAAYADSLHSLLRVL